MRYTEEQMAEMDILIRYNLQSTQQGIKVHSRANKEQIAAVQRLFDKGLVTAVDGGYLTDLGRKAAEHAQALLLILAPHQQSMAS
ncbi:MAG: TIGR02647 family protein [Gammaproteobacteria bacterium]|nr:TIGR02647 family protein [Gammaproteobacteria bacterium]MCW8941863.1 TIGR02647 family protein [Gammaproteobacteria bacterium]